MDARKLIVRTADQTRRADIDVDHGTTGAALIQAAVDNWSLPSDVDYTLVNTTTGAVVVPGQSLDSQARPGDVLEVQPVLVAGGRWR